MEEKWLEKVIETNTLVRELKVRVEQAIEKDERAHADMKKQIMALFILSALMASGSDSAVRGALIKAVNVAPIFASTKEPNASLDNQ